MIRNSHLYRAAVLGVVLLVCAGCSKLQQGQTPLRATAAVEFEEDIIAFYRLDGSAVARAPRPCGAPIEPHQVTLQDLGDQGTATASPASSTADAMLASEDFVQTRLWTSEAETVAYLQRYFASLGCDLLVLGGVVHTDVRYWRERGFSAADARRIPPRSYLRLVWGLQLDAPLRVDPDRIVRETGSDKATARHETDT